MGGRPQQPELNRSGTTALTPDSIAGEVQARRDLPDDEQAGTVPEGNRPGHHPGREQDKPDPEAFAARARGDTRPPLDDLRAGRGPLLRAGIAVAGAAGTAVGVSRVVRRRLARRGGQSP